MVAVVIGESNKAFFRNLISDDVWATLNKHGVLAIGAVLEDIDYSVASGMAVGALVAELDEVLELTWLYVAPAFRNTGVGTLLLTTLTDTVRSVDSATRAYTLLSAGEEDEHMHAFLAARGFSFEQPSNAMVYTVEAGALLRIAEKLRLPETPDVIQLERLPDIYLKLLANDSHAAPDVPIKKEDYLPCSSCIVRNGTVCGLFLFQTGSNEGPALVYAWGKNTNDMSKMLVVSTKLIAEQYPPQTPVELSTLNSVSRSLAQSLGVADSGTAIMLATKDI